MALITFGAIAEYPGPAISCVSLLWRMRYIITLAAILIQWDANELWGILQFSLTFSLVCWLSHQRQLLGCRSEMWVGVTSGESCFNLLVQLAFLPSNIPGLPGPSPRSTTGNCRIPCHIKISGLLEKMATRIRGGKDLPTPHNMLSIHVPVSGWYVVAKTYPPLIIC